MNPVRIKFCGLTRVADVQAALSLGVDAIGFNLARGPRRISVDTARDLARLVHPLVTSVALFADADEATILESMRLTRCQVVQLHGAEPWDLIERLQERFPVIKAETLRSRDDLTRLKGHPADALILDAPGGGSGHAWNYDLLEDGSLERPFILAGGLTPANVASAILRVNPMGVDVASGIEQVPAHKDPALMRAFVEAVRGVAPRGHHPSA